MPTELEYAIQDYIRRGDFATAEALAKQQQAKSSSALTIAQLQGTGNFVEAEAQAKKQQAADAALLKSQTPVVPIAPPNYKPTLDPLLMEPQLFSAAGRPSTTLAQPVTRTVQDIIRPLIPIIEKSINERTLQAQSNAQSEFMRRGLTGGSTELQTITRDLPAQGTRDLADAESQLLLQAIPLAQREKESLAGAQAEEAKFGVSMRSLVSNEQFQTMSLEQKDRITQADNALRLELQRIDNEANMSLLLVQQNFERAQNAEDRAIAEKQYQDILNEKQRARRTAFLKGITTVIGAGVGGSVGGVEGAKVGAVAGNAVDFGFLM